jgi:prolyl-tRNA synthetase
MKTDNKITSRAEDYSKWYLDVIREAGLVDESPVKGCMVMRPYGYAIWEKIQQILDAQFKATGVENAYFPLLIPKSFFEKEAAHVSGFAKECAVVTHHRLESDGHGGLVPAGKLEEPLIIRPTSETIMYSVFARWIQSYRDLPLLINQWANIVRWEMRTRPFLRTTEFLWQEGHTAHATRNEAEQKTLQMLEIYRKFAEQYLAIPAVAGKKTDSEKFSGAEYTATIEAMMQDGKALQSGTSHLLGQNFAKAFEVKFLDQSGNQEYVWQTSWGLSTRIIGGIIMTHSDDQGLVLPPNIAPIPVVIVPVWVSETEKSAVLAEAEKLAQNLRENYQLTVRIDDREGRPGPKFFDWERKGVPVRVEIGPKDLVKGSLITVRRDTGVKTAVALGEAALYIKNLLTDIQNDLLAKATTFRESHTHLVDSWTDFQQILEQDGGFLQAHWCGSAACEEKIKEETKATTRCIPFDQPQESGVCVYCGQPSQQRVIFAKAY